MEDRVLVAPPKTLDEQIQFVVNNIQSALLRINKAEEEIERLKKTVKEAREQYLQLSEQRRKEQDAAALDT